MYWPMMLVALPAIAIGIGFRAVSQVSATGSYSQVWLDSLKLGVEPTDDVDFAVVGLVRRINKRSTFRHWSAGAPTVRCDIVDLRLVL